MGINEREQGIVHSFCFHLFCERGICDMSKRTREEEDMEEAEQIDAGEPARKRGRVLFGVRVFEDDDESVCKVVELAETSILVAALRGLSRRKLSERGVVYNMMQSCFEEDGTTITCVPIDLVINHILESGDGDTKTLRRILKKLGDRCLGRGAHEEARSCGAVARELEDVCQRDLQLPAGTAVGIMVPFIASLSGGEREYVLRKLSGVASGTDGIMSRIEKVIGIRQ